MSDNSWDSTRSIPKPMGGKKPRQRGKAVEAEIAKRLGGTRVPMSGAVKNSVHNLKGDVTVPDAIGKPFFLLEAKLSGTLNAKGERTYNLKKSVLIQARDEARSQQQLGAFRLHFANDRYEDDWVVMSADDWELMLEYAKRGING